MLVLTLICRRVRLYRSFSRIIKVLCLLGFRFCFFPQLQQRISQPTPSSALLFCCISRAQCGPSAHKQSHKHTHTSYRGFCLLDGSRSIKIVVLKVSAGFQGQVALSMENIMSRFDTIQYWDHGSIRFESYVYSAYAFNVSYY